ncbi:MAG TPA: lysylphosphatidylglycerol synthase transmembrane domain-containing protein, partial [Anaerolineae bacterium]|nr:lysylphosphatidylglycerol synthase transmembrane domain-containing protein [Anaerolineae bacterium]
FILTRVVKRQITFTASVRVYLGGSFFGLVTPFGSGLLPAQIYILANEGLSPGQATAVASSRATISSWIFVLLGLVVFIAFRSSLPSPIGGDLLLGVIIAAIIWLAIIIFFIKRPESAKKAVLRITESRIISNRVQGGLLDKIRDRMYKEIDHLSSNLRSLFSYANIPAIAAILASEAIAWLGIFAVLPLTLLGFGVRGNLAQLIFRMLLLFSLAPVSPTPGGSGVVEVASTGLLLNIVPAHIIGLVVLVWRALTYYLLLLAGGIVILRFIAKSALPRD